MSMQQAGVLDSSPLWPCCQRCQRQDCCPYVCDQLLCYAACQGCASAQALEYEAYRQTELLSRLVDCSCLLCSDRAINDTLSQALKEELDVIDSLCTQAQIRSI